MSGGELGFITVDGFRHSSYSPKIRRGVLILTNIFGPPLHTWLLYLNQLSLHEHDWLRVEDEHFSVDKTRKYFPSSPFKYAGVSKIGWRSREHVACLFGEDDEEFHNLIRKHMVMTCITGEFFQCHLEEVAKGKYFALEKPNAGGAPIDVHCIVIGSTWRRCSESLAVAESSTAAAEYLMGQYDAVCKAERRCHSLRPGRATIIGGPCYYDHDV